MGTHGRRWRSSYLLLGPAGLLGDEPGDALGLAHGGCGRDGGGHGHGVVLLRRHSLHCARELLDSSSRECARRADSASKEQRGIHVEERPRMTQNQVHLMFTKSKA